MGAPVRFDLASSIHRSSHGHVLVGGSPFQIITLTNEHQDLLDRILAGSTLELSDEERELSRELVQRGFLYPQVATSSLGLTDIDIVIPCHQHGHELSRLLANLPVESFASVTVVDDGSVEAVTCVDLGVEVVRLDTNRGPAAARQVGAESGSAPLVLFLDADVSLPTTPWLEALVHWCCTDRVAAAAARVMNSSNTDDEPFDRGGAAGFVAPRSHIPFVSTAALLVRRDAFDSVGGFDGEMRGGEDVDLVWRLIESGWHVRYEPSSVVRHPLPSSYRQLVHQRASYGRSQAALAERHPAAITPLEISPYSVAAWGLLFTGRRGVGAGAAVVAGSIGGLVPHLRDRVADPARLAVELAGVGNLRAGMSIARAVRRAWLPLALLLSLFVRPARNVTVAALLASIVDNNSRPDRASVRRLLVALVDDAAFSVGVLHGSIEHRSARALRPRWQYLDDLLVTSDQLFTRDD